MLQLVPEFRVLGKVGIPVVDSEQVEAVVGLELPDPVGDLRLAPIGIELTAALMTDPLALDVELEGITGVDQVRPNDHLVHRVLSIGQQIHSLVARSRLGPDALRLATVVIAAALGLVLAVVLALTLTCMRVRVRIRH